jgi:hypothetical protein
MTGESQNIRASDAERERIAQIVQLAGAEGRLTLTETEERLGEVYAAKYVDELSALTTDLPSSRTPSPRTFRPHPALRVHAALVLAVSLLLVVRWSVSDAAFFWPVAPIFWLTMSLFVHARIRGAGRQRGPVVPY